ncbi:hypothetical protein C1N72_22370 (plasmid) [Pantoea ananatis]
MRNRESPLAARHVQVKGPRAFSCGASCVTLSRLIQDGHYRYNVAQETAQRDVRTAQRLWCSRQH